MLNTTQSAFYTKKIAFNDIINYDSRGVASIVGNIVSEMIKN